MSVCPNLTKGVEFVDEGPPAGLCAAIRVEPLPQTGPKFELMPLENDRTRIAVNLRLAARQLTRLPQTRQKLKEMDREPQTGGTEPICGRFNTDIVPVVAIGPKRPMAATDRAIANSGVGDFALSSPVHRVTMTVPDHHLPCLACLIERVTGNCRKAHLGEKPHCYYVLRWRP
jgi:hypothetical protein